jgi:3-oxoacyl-[acyl-carrier protein] reductase
VSLESKIGLVTGASGTLGQALVRRLAAQGARLLLHYHRKAEAVEHLAARFPDAVLDTVALDLGTLDMDPLARRLDQLPGLDFVVTCHGATRYDALPTIPAADVDRLVRLNLTSHLLVVREAYDRLRHRQGRIVLVSSIWAETGAAAEVPYAAAKGGLVTAARSLAQELAADGVAVVAVLPGFFTSPMNEGRSAGSLPVTDADTVAAAIAEVLAAPRPPRTLLIPTAGPPPPHPA